VILSGPCFGRWHQERGGEARERLDLRHAFGYG